MKLGVSRIRNYRTRDSQGGGKRGRQVTCGVYAIRNILNGHVYIGSSKNIEKRWLRHCSDLHNGRHINRHLQRAWIKYGFGNFAFEILETTSFDLATQREQFYLDTMRPVYNISRSAFRPEVDITDEHKAAISRANTGRVKSPEQRKRISEGTKRGMSRPEIQKRMAELAEEHRGQTLTEEHKRKISLSLVGRPGVNIGRKASEETRRRISAAGMGRKPSEETLRKRSVALKGKRLSEEHKRKLSVAATGRPSPQKGKPGRPLSEEAKRKLSVANKGKTLTEEHKRKVGDASRGRQHTEESKRRMSESRKGKPGTPHTDEFKQNLAERRRGQPHSEETKRKIGDAGRGRKASEETRRKMSESHLRRQAQKREDADS